MQPCNQCHWPKVAILSHEHLLRRRVPMPTDKILSPPGIPSASSVGGIAMVRDSADRTVVHDFRGRSTCSIKDDTTGTPQQPLHIQPGAASLALTGGTFALTHDGSTHTALNDFKGSSRSTVKDGSIEIEVVDRPATGRANEPNVLDVLSGVLGAKWTAGEDANGEDGTLILKTGETLAVQIVSVPADSKHWREVSTGKASVKIPFMEAAAWINDAIAKKLTIAAADRRKMVLALDIRHSAQLANEAVVAVFRQDFPDPAGHGFAQIWLVGPISKRCEQLA